MYNKKISLFAIPFLGAILFSSCWPEPETTPCLSRVDYYAGNNTSKTIVVDYVVNNNSYNFNTHFTIQREPFLSYETVVESDAVLHFLFLLGSQDSMCCCMSYQGVLLNPYTVTKIQGCNLPLDNSSLLYYNVYSLDDTAIYRGYTIFPSYYYEEWMGMPPRTMTEFSSAPFVTYWWDYNAGMNTNNICNYLTVDSMMLACMQKDTTMLDLFADYYGR